jgi:hypothetical protein
VVQWKASFSENAAFDSAQSAYSADSTYSAELAWYKGSPVSLKIPFHSALTEHSKIKPNFFEFFLGIKFSKNIKGLGFQPFD